MLYWNLWNTKMYNCFLAIEAIWTDPRFGNTDQPGFPIVTNYARMSS